MNLQAIGTTGGVCWLSGYIGVTRNWFDTKSGFYLILNQVASALLLSVALATVQPGFIVVNGVFFFVNGNELLKRWAERRPTIQLHPGA